MTTIENGEYVLPHVRAFAAACQKATGVETYKTYHGHSPDISRALDIWPPANNRDLGTDVAEFAIANMERYGVTYVIWRQQIYNPGIAPRWRDMADRGGVTQNHFDHAHISFDVSAPAPTEEENDLSTEERAMLLEMHTQLMHPEFGVGKALANLNEEIIALREKVDALKPKG